MHVKGYKSISLGLIVVILFAIFPVTAYADTVVTYGIYDTTEVAYINNKSTYEDIVFINLGNCRDYHLSAKGMENCGFDFVLWDNFFLQLY